MGEDGLGAWDRNVVKLGCDDGCTTINIIKFTELKKKKKKSGILRKKKVKEKKEKEKKSRSLS